MQSGFRVHWGRPDLIVDSIPRTGLNVPRQNDRFSAFSFSFLSFFSFFLPSLSVCVCVHACVYLCRGRESLATNLRAGACMCFTCACIWVGSCGWGGGRGREACVCVCFCECVGLYMCVCVLSLPPPPPKKKKSVAHFNKDKRDHLQFACFSQLQSIVQCTGQNSTSSQLVLESFVIKEAWLGAQRVISYFEKNIQTKRWPSSSITRDISCNQITFVGTLKSASNHHALQQSTQ